MKKTKLTEFEILDVLNIIKENINRNIIKEKFKIGNSIFYRIKNKEYKNLGGI